MIPRHFSRLNMSSSSQRVRANPITPEIALWLSFVQEITPASNHPADRHPILFLCLLGFTTIQLLPMDLIRSFGPSVSHISRSGPRDLGCLPLFYRPVFKCEVGSLEAASKTAVANSRWLVLKVAEELLL